MRRDNSVFFFTLVDFLLTTTFFALVLYALSAHNANNAGRKTAEAELSEISKAAGVSDLTELTDALTRLGPIRDALKDVETVKRAGGAAQVARVTQLVSAEGGYDSVTASLARLRKKEGYGKPPCEFVVDKNGNRTATDIGVIQANDSVITFVRPTAPLDSLLDALHLSFDEVRSLGLKAFQGKFAPVVALRPDCRYFIRFEEHTRFVDARDAAQKGFGLHIVKP